MCTPVSTNFLSLPPSKALRPKVCALISLTLSTASIKLAGLPEDEIATTASSFLIKHLIFHKNFFS